MTVLILGVLRDFVNKTHTKKAFFLYNLGTLSKAAFENWSICENAEHGCIGIVARREKRLYNDYMIAKRRKAFRRAALRLSKTAWLFCHIFIAMSIGRMIH